MMPDMDGLALLTALQQEMPRMPVIILTGRATVDTAVGAMSQGAYDYLTKPVDLGPAPAAGREGPGPGPDPGRDHDPAAAGERRLGDGPADRPQRAPCGRSTT